MSDQEKHPWPDCKEVQCQQAHETLNTVMDILNIECPDNIYVVGKMVRICQAIGDMKVQIAEQNTMIETIRIACHSPKGRAPQ